MLWSIWYCMLWPKAFMASEASTHKLKTHSAHRAQMEAYHTITHTHTHSQNKTQHRSGIKHDLVPFLGLLAYFAHGPPKFLTCKFGPKVGPSLTFDCGGLRLERVASLQCHQMAFCYQFLLPPPVTSSNLHDNGKAFRVGDLSQLSAVGHKQFQ